jgi:3-oxoacyl-[acyl-carrier protein] reductase
MNTQMTREILRASPQLAGDEEFAQAQRKAADDGDADFSRAAALCLFLATAESDGITGKLISAVWDDWRALAQHKAELASSDVYTLRRIVPADRGLDWGKVS